MVWVSMVKLYIFVDIERDKKMYSTKEQRKHVAGRLTYLANPNKFNNSTMELLNVAAMLIYPGIKLIHGDLPGELFPREKHKCEYCGEEDCDNDCNESQAGGFDELKIGTYVKFNAETGSTGKITALIKDGPFKYDNRFYVEWVYGRDVAGDIMKENSGYVRRDELIIITEVEYMKVRDREGFGS